MLSSQQKGQKLQRSELHNSRTCLQQLPGREMLHRQRNLEHPGQLGVSAGAGCGARALGREQSSLAHVGVHVWAAPSTPREHRQCQAAGDSQENAPRAGMARAVPLPCQERSAHLLPGVPAQLQCCLGTVTGQQQRF